MIFSENLGLSCATLHGALTPCRVSGKSNKPISRKLPDRRTDGRTDRPEFIGPFQPWPEVQSKLTKKP